MEYCKLKLLSIFSQTNIEEHFPKMCQHQAAYRYYAKSVESKEPLIGRLCDSLDDIKKGICTGEESAMGGEPGAKKYVEMFERFNLFV